MNTRRNLLACIAFICLLLPVFHASASQVTPSDRVSSHVNVRQQDNSSSTAVGTLQVGETAELIESVPYWHYIRLSDGTPGYVSKAWTVIVSDDPADASNTAKTDLIIGSWNIKWFGYYNEDRHDYPRMADIIQNFDLVAVQELRGSQYVDRLDKIIAELATRGFRYTYTVSEETGYADHPDADDTVSPKKNYLERYAFLWDTDRLHPVDPTDPHQFVDQPPINNDSFRQVPIVGDFEVNNGNGFDFRILTVHTVYSESLDEVRQSEIQFINDWMIDLINDTANAEKDIIAIGDFNANPDGQPHHFDAIITGTNNYRILMNEPLAAGEPSLRTTIQQSNNPDPEYFLLPVYDHILVSPATSIALPHDPMTREADDLGIEEFDQESGWQGYTWNEVIRAMSDHRPVWFRVDYNAADLD